MISSEGSTWDLILVMALLFIISVLMGWLSGRILGVARGWVRSVVAGVIGFFGGLALLDFQTNGDVVIDFETRSTSDNFAILAGWLGYTLIVTLVVSLVIDAMLRPRRRRRAWSIPHPIRALKSRISVWSRVTQIGAIARRNGLVSPQIASRSALMSPETARALRLTLEESGGMLVKFGQIASTREDLLPPSITGELAKLRTSVPGLPPEVVKAVIAEELGAPVSELFAEFDPQPLAAASIGVTHRARLHDGRRVIVKVQRPGVEESVDRDGQVLIWTARKLAQRSDTLRSMGVVALAQELVAGIKEELDFTREAANNQEMRESRSGDAGVAFPEIFMTMTTRRVLVMQEVAGTPVSDTAAVDATGVPRRDLADNLMDSFLAQVLEDGTYHADPHPGNILVDEQGVLWFIDFGSVGHLDPVTLEGLQQMGMGFTLRDPSILARAVRRIAGRQGESIDIASLEFDIGVVLTDTQGGGFDPNAISEIIRVLNRHGVAAPQALTLLARAVLTLDGTLRIIDADYRMGPAAQERMAHIVQHAELNPRDQLTRELVRALPALKSLPQISEDIALQARSGRFTLRVDRWEGADGRRLDRWINLILFSAIGMAGLIGSALLLMAAGMSTNDVIANPLRVIGFAGLFLSAAMMMRVVAQILNTRDPDDPI